MKIRIWATQNKQRGHMRPASPQFDMPALRNKTTVKLGYNELGYNEQYFLFSWFRSFL
jgi:hypothetical protein